MHPMNLSKTLILLLIFVLPVVKSYNVLFLMPVGARSHNIALNPIAQELGRRGHKVTIFSPFKENTNPVGVNSVPMSSWREMDAAMDAFSYFDSPIKNFFSLEAMRTVHAGIIACLKNFYLDPFVQDLILHPYAINGTSMSSLRYDVVVVSGVLNEFNLPLAHHLGAPIVYASALNLSPMLAWSMNIPRPPYLPCPLMYFDDTLTIVQRAFNAFANFVFVQMWARFQLPSFDEHVREFLPQAPSISDISKNVSFVISNSHFSIYPSAPSMPYHAEVGGLHCKPAKKLPKDLEDFMQSSGDHGVIYFSLGTVQKGKNAPEGVKEKLLTVFRELPQKILWKHESKLQELPGNIKLITWAPQQDILGHPKLRLFISHGGLMSYQETAYHGKPVLMFPLASDQGNNAGNAVRLGIAEHLDWRTFTIENLREKINKLLSNPKYTENAKKVSSHLRDRPQHPAEVAAYWIEYVVRHNGAHHLKSDAEHLNYFQYFLLDVISIAIIVSCVLFFLIVIIFRKFIKYLCVVAGGRAKSKQLINNEEKAKKN